MYIQLPLCYPYVDGRIGRNAVSATFLKYGDAQEVESAFHTQGQRVGDQSGLYAAHINELTVDVSRRIVDYEGQLTAINCSHPHPWSDAVVVNDRRVRYDAYGTVWTQDGDYQYTGYYMVQVHLWFAFVAGLFTCTLDYAYLTTNALYRCSQEYLRDVEVSRGMWRPEYSIALRGLNEKIPLDFPSLADVTQQGLFAKVQDALHALVMPSVAENMVTAFMRSTTWSQQSSHSRTIVYDVPAFDYSEVFGTLLHTYEFEDPKLALGLIDRTTHFARRTERTPYGERERDVLVAHSSVFDDYVFNWLLQHAWFDAVSSIQQANQNSIQNVIEAGKLLIALKNGNFSSLSQSLMSEWEDWTRNAKSALKAYGNIWLKYRYVYSTTKMDVEEYVEFGLHVIDKYMQSITQSRTHGHAEYGGYECNCSMTWEEKAVTGFAAFCRGLWRSGLEPNLYVIWDFVPFSFVVDWGLLGLLNPTGGSTISVGDYLEVMTGAEYRNELYYRFEDIVFSIRYDTGPIVGVTCSHYVRWVASHPPVFDGSYWIETGGSSTNPTTTVKRVMDAGALAVGMLK